MAVNSFNEGAVSPLLSIWRHTLWLSGVLLLSACGSHSELPPFTASGYVGDRGRYAFGVKTPVTMFTCSRYLVRGEKAKPLPVNTAGRVIRSLIELNVYSKPAEHVRIRFDDRGELSFMQREVDGQKQQLSSDQIALYRYRADQIRQTSDALRQGRVILRQGRWHADNTVTTCEGETLKPDRVVGDKPYRAPPETFIRRGECGMAGSARRVAATASRQ